MAAYDLVYDSLVRALPERREVMAYLQADLRTTLYRIRVRGREEEQSIDPTYLEALIGKHEALYSTYVHEKVLVPAEAEKGAIFTRA